MQLAEAVEKLYAAFERYPLRAEVTCCAHCVFPEDSAQLCKAPLRELAPWQLSKFAFKAMSTWGDVNDFRHFLPRIFELLSLDGGGDWIDPEIVFGQLPYGEFRTWPILEQHAVETFSRSLWDAVIDQPGHRFETDACLCSLSFVFDDVAPLLQSWTPPTGVGRAATFLAFLRTDYLWKFSVREVLRSPWWQQRPAQHQQAIDWFLSPDRLSEIEDLFFNASDPELEKILSESGDMLRHLKPDRRKI